MRIFALVSSIFMLLAASAAAQTVEQSPTVTHTLDNGMTLVLKENHSSPMITSVVFVNAGARYESDANNGVTHFLEHLLFNGTETRDRVVLNETVDMYGGYINAFTRKDLTAYMILMPAEYIDIGLDIQSDQLFHSTIPENMLPKERKIVIEEIKMNVDDPDHQADRFYTETVYRGTPYERPVLGYEEIISTIPRAEILDYYKTYYMPNNMIALVIGDFDTMDMIERMERFYGDQEPSVLPDFDEVSLSIPDGRHIERAEFDIKQARVNLATNAPHYTDPDYFAFYLLAEYLGSGEMSPLNSALTGGGSPLAQRASAYLETQKDFSLFHVSATATDPSNADSIVGVIEEVLSDPAAITPSEDDLNALVVSLKTNDIYYRERLHMYGIVVAPMMVTTGYDFLDQLIPNLEQVTVADVRRVAEKYFTDLSYLGTVALPGPDTSSSEGSPGMAGMGGMHGMSAPHGMSTEDAAAKSDIDRKDFSYDEYEERILTDIPEATESHSTYLQETLPNGLNLIIKSNPDSRVFAINVLGKNRSAHEPEGKEGITDFVNRMMLEGTAKMTRDEIASELASIGANITETDNPFIPYDDRYTTHQYSFIKFETIDEFMNRGMDLIADLIQNATFEEEAIERVREEKIGLAGRSTGSTREQCRKLFYDALFGDGPYSKSIMGTPRSIAAITREDLLKHYSSFYAPNNMIVTVCSNAPAERVLSEMKDRFAGMEPKDLADPVIPPPSALSDVVETNVPMEKEQVYIYIGGPTIGIGHEDAAALSLAGSVLSDRLQEELREKQGLAYSVGAGVSFDKDFGWYVAAMGTGKENFAIARDGMLDEIRRLQTEGVTPNELKKAKNSKWGTSLMRNLSRVNQAYNMGVHEFLGVGYNYRDEWIDAIRGVTAEDVVRAAKKYFSAEKYILATAGLPENVQKAETATQ